MSNSFHRSVAAAVAFFALTSAALAEHGEFNDMCATGLAMHKQVKSDCTSRATYNGKTYCFGNQKAEVIFFKDPDSNLQKAEAYWSEIHKGGSK